MYCTLDNEAFNTVIKNLEYVDDTFNMCTNTIVSCEA